MIKTEPTFNVKVENDDEQLELLQEIVIKNTHNQTSNVVQNQVDKLNAEKNQLVSDFLALKEDYDRVCEKLNKKEAECCELILLQTTIQTKLDVENAEVLRLQMEIHKMKEMKKMTSTKKAENDVYEVEQIIAHKKVNNELFFLIRWRNYGSEDDTWERKENLNCNKILRNYLKHNNVD